MKRFRFRAIGLLISIMMLAFSVISCSPAKPPAAQNGVVKLTLLSHYSAQYQQGLQKYIDQWNKENPNIQVSQKSVSDFTQLLPTIMAQQTSGQQADILHVYSLWAGQLTKNNVLAAPPDDIVSDVKTNYSSAAQQGATAAGKIIGYPTEVETYALFYNKKLLSNAGYSNPPKTWDDLYKMGKAITKRDASGKVSLEGFGWFGGWDSAVVHPYLSLVYTAGGSFLSSDNKSAQINSPAGLQALQFEQKFFTDKISDPSIDVMKGFPSENVAMTIQAEWFNNTCKTTMGDKFANVGVAPIPSPDGTKNGSISYSFFWGVNKNSKYQKEAWQFLKWLNSKGISNGATAEGQFLLSQNLNPSRNSDITALKKDLDTPNNKPFLDALNYSVVEPNVEQGQQIKTDMQKQIEAVWSGQTSPQDALTNVTTQINQLLGK